MNNHIKKDRVESKKKKYTDRRLVIPGKYKFFYYQVVKVI